jgi:tetratricopeptide (TPR) repeat protein
MLFEYCTTVIRCVTFVMKKLAVLILLFSLLKSAFSINRDSIANSPIAGILDSLHQELQQAANDSLKAGIYSQIALKYLNYDTISNKKTKLYYQEEALKYTLLGLHCYSKYNDSTGLRISFNNLSHVYRSQKKYSQAKWFILQSNTISRTQNDIPNIISSLKELAEIKMDIKDYSLAMRDLNEALKLSSTHHYARAESAIEESYALLYSHLKNYDKEALAMKRHNFIDDSIRKAENAQLIAKLNAQDAVQNKKKINTISYRRTYRGTSLKRIASI